jgi:hypothetical protein
LRQTHQNRFVAWTGSENDEPITKGLDGISDSNPAWIRRRFKKILFEIIKHPETRFEVIPKMIKEAFTELDSGCLNAEEELKYTQHLNLHSYEYEPGVRAGVLAKLLGKDKGDLVYWYETYTEGYVESKKYWKKKRRSYSVKPEKINLEECKNLLLKKLKDTLDIAGFNMSDLRLRQSLSQHTTTIPSKFKGISMFGGGGCLAKH